MDKIGYIISEAPVLILVIWGAICLIRYRRWRRQEPLYSADDAALFFPQNKIDLRSPATWLKFARCIALATAATCVEFLTLAEFGAAILSVSLMLTTAGIIHRVLFNPA